MAIRQYRNRIYSAMHLPRPSRHIELVLAGMVLIALASCTGGTTEPSADASPQYIATIPSLAMVVRPVVSGRATVHTLLKPGDSPHTYAPVPSDIRAAADADAVFFGSEHLDGWAADLPAERRIALVGLLPDSLQRRFEGETKGSGIVDPHFWTDPLAVAGVLPALTDTLCAVDHTGCDMYRANADSFAVVLDRLDHELKTMMAPVRGDAVVLAQPFFGYFLARYGPRLVGVVEPAPAKEPSPRHIQRMVESTKADRARAVLTQRQLSDRSARALAEAADVPLVALDPIGGVEERTQYEELLRWNARTLREALRTDGP